MQRRPVEGNAGVVKVLRCAEGEEEEMEGG